MERGSASTLSSNLGSPPRLFAVKQKGNARSETALDGVNTKMFSCALGPSRTLPIPPLAWEYRRMRARAEGKQDAVETADGRRLKQPHARFSPSTPVGARILPYDSRATRPILHNHSHPEVDNYSHLVGGYITL